MTENLGEVQALLREKAERLARLNVLPYDGTPEIKIIHDAKYLYVRKRVGSRKTSTYVGAYTDELYQLLLKNARERKEQQKALRLIEKRLAALGYEEGELSPLVQRNLDFARANLKANIYDQAILEGVATSFPQTEEIIDNGAVNGMTVTDVQKILNLKHAWEFILDRDVLQCASDYYILCHIAALVNENFFADGGRLRSVPVNIGGTSYVPKIPLEFEVRDKIGAIAAHAGAPIETAMDLALYCMRTQIFLDGNKRAAIIFANHHLIAQGGGLLVIPEKLVPDFKKLLVEFYESDADAEIKKFLRESCWRRMD